MSRAAKRLLVTGSSGLIGSEVSLFFGSQGFSIHGIDNNQRAVFFGPAGDTRWNQKRLASQIPAFSHHELDIRDREGVLALIKEIKPDGIVHTAAQPSHDRAAAIPFDDFDTNAVGTLNLLEAARRTCPEVPFIHMSTNKVYGDRPNFLPLREMETRWDYADSAYAEGIPETFSIDQSKHSLFGASKVAADVMVQEYGRYFNMPTCCLRGGCLTGPNHSGVELHGFLSYLVKCNLEDREYRIFGYKGKQVRDNIHSEDVSRFIFAFFQAPRAGEVYNLGGGKANSCSILEAFRLAEKFSGKPMKYSYLDENRIGDHICYYSDLHKMKAHYPAWDITKTLEQTIGEIVESWRRRLKKAPVEAAKSAPAWRETMNPNSGSMDEQVLNLLGTPLLVTTYAHLLDQIFGWSQRPGPTAVDFSNTQIVTMRRTDPGFFEITGAQDYFVPDGMPLIWGLRALGAQMPDRVYGPAFMRYALSHDTKLRHYFLGGSITTLEKLVMQAQAMSDGRFQLAGSHHGYLKPEDGPRIVEEINRLSPDVVWIGMGTPKQQQWIYDYKSQIKRGVLLAVGFAFDVNAGTKRDAPMWMQRLGITWIFRISQEPSRLLGRYLWYNTWFVVLVLIDLFRFFWKTLKRLFRMSS